ncbi:hydroxymethylglutaryl-CoA lyase [Caballeronia sp. LP006]|uniref:hydroxymethylglutaryl-CoA lyase n=1 Tax=Caballeronia sp. LP006 TaxID=3038552 RepID=UPI0028579920|nr:hydroxymethylglutaryl-CoA lyase [Caballeronia sp. LP006]MDR5832330.1 hydroxymethylglutaryl-CoA lyase [Caballeronia sp. LP006]
MQIQENSSPVVLSDKPFVTVTEVGTRDGLQIEPTFVPTKRKIELINDMLAAGIKNIEVTSFVSPKAVPQLADAEEVLAGIERRPDTRLSALVPNLRAAERAVQTGLDAAVLLCSASNTHNRKNLNRSVDESLAGLDEVAQVLLAPTESRQPKALIGAVATAFGCPFEGDIPIEQVEKIARRYVEVGVTEVTLSDTTGMATPENIRRLVRAIRAALPSSIELALHLHNTRGIGLANVIVGLEEGITRYDSSVGGLGGCPFAAGATGNICTEDLLFLLQESGYETGVDLEKAILVAKKMEAFLGKGLVGQVMKAGPRLRLHATDAVATAAG